MQARRAAAVGRRLACRPPADVETRRTALLSARARGHGRASGRLLSPSIHKLDAVDKSRQPDQPETAPVQRGPTRRIRPRTAPCGHAPASKQAQQKKRPH